MEEGGVHVVCNVVWRIDIVLTDLLKWSQPLLNTVSALENWDKQLKMGKKTLRQI